MALPLEGLKVLDASRLLPGPYATLVLADLGAQVDKLEDPHGGDPARAVPPFRGDASAAFLGLNRNKRSIALDLKSPQGIATLKRLVCGYDVLVESFRPGVMDKLGCGYEALARENPRLIYCAISGFGQTGPDRARAGHDLNFVARAGVLGLEGPSGAPVPPPVQVADIGGGSLFALVGILAALHERSRTGLGRLVDVAMTDGAAAFLHLHLATQWLPSAEERAGTLGSQALSGVLPCYRLYRTQDDRHMAVAALEPKFWASLCAALGLPELEPLGHALGPAADEAARQLEAVFASRPLAEWVERLRSLDACVEPVAQADELTRDPQLRARGLFLEADGATWLKSPLHFGPVAVRPAPQLGQHSEEILGELGLLP